MKETVIRIQDSGMVAIEEANDGIRSFKRIAPDDFLQCLKGSITNKISSGLLPDGCLSYSQNDRGDKSVCLLFPDSKADISYYETVYKDFPLPRLVFGFDISIEGRISSCKIGIPDNQNLLKPSTPMFCYPFSNVNGFNLCTGNNRFPKCKSLHTVASLSHFILSMPNNNDMFSNQRNKLHLEIRDLFELLKDKQPEYYYSYILLPYSNMTLKDFIN